VRRLSNATLGQLPADVAQPGYDRAQVKTGVIHLGLGAFHRAHQAVVFDDAIAGGDPRWGVLGVSLRSPGVRDQMAPQDGLYGLVERDGSGERIRVIGVVKAVLVAPEDPAAVLAALAAPDTHIVTLTITEKGYKLRSGQLDRDDPDIAHDLASLTAPRTAPGFLVAGLAARREAGLPPFTALSCDNLPHNGRLLREAVLAMARAHDTSLASWIEQEGAFPQTMVDRIVPATTAADVDAMSTRLGVEDQALVKTEPFFQWVIEDRFCGPRPAFEALGVRLTDDVAPWEEAKLRLLNGAHSGIAYLGGLAGVEFVHAFVADAAGRRFVEALWQESTATLTPPPGFDLDRYRADLMARFSNPALQHRTRQIAMDGSQKLPQRLLAPIAARRAKGLSVDALALAVAAWMRWQSGADDGGIAFTIDDPLAATTAACLAGLSDPADQVDALLAIEPIFPAAIASDVEVRAALVRHLTSLRDRGARATWERFAV
jgi:fructuronate reductase